MRPFFALVPIKDPEHGKSRLASVLDSSSRHALNLLLAEHTLDVCIELFGAARTIVVSGAPEIEELAKLHNVTLILESTTERSLNSALSVAGRFAIESGAEGIVVVPTDLALLSGQSLRSSLAHLPPAPGCLLVPDRRQSGTNILALSPARADLFSYGETSLRRHTESIRVAGYDVQLHYSEALALDLDVPEDLKFAGALPYAGKEHEPTVMTGYVGGSTLSIVRNVLHRSLERGRGAGKRGNAATLNKST